MASEHVPFVDLSHQDSRVAGEVRAELDALVAAGDYILGHAVDKFEAEFARYLGCRHAVGLSSGTDALILALRALGVGAGDEVVVPAFGFVATAEAVVLAGATPVFADVAPETLTISPASVARVITPRTVAVIAVHLYGHPADTDALRRLIDPHGIALIEDAAQAHGATVSEKPIGSLGTISCFSFYPTKNLGAWGDAGAVATDDEGLAERIRCLRHHGQLGKHHHVSVGTNARLDTLQAAVLRVKLRYLDGWIEERRQLADLYKTMLPPELQRPEAVGHCNPAWHLYVVRHSQRDALGASLARRGVQTAVHYPYNVSELPPYRAYRRDADCTEASSAARTVLSLPLFPGLAADSLAYIADGVREWMRKAA